MKTSISTNNNKIQSFVHQYSHKLDDYKKTGAVISQPYGGLGDNLAYSTLPERLSEHGVECYISDKNTYRNNDIKELILSNPYIKGISSKIANAGDINGHIFDKLLPISIGFIERIEIAHGLEPKNHRPIIYYKPKHIASLSDKILIDIGSITADIPRDALIDYIKFIIQKYKYATTDLMQIVFPNPVATKNTFIINDLEKITVNNLFYYCDALNSAYAFITVNSGAQSLAVAIKNFDSNLLIHSYALPIHYNWRNYIYNDVEYYVK
jgi:hypothetical protein